jgi:hypothetical protein
VWGAEVAAHFADDGALTSINAQQAGALRPADGRCATGRRRPSSGPGGGTRPAVAGRRGQELAQPELGVWPGGTRGVNGALAWRLVQSVRTPDGTPQHYATFVDGNSGAVLARHALVHTEVTPTTGTATNLFGKPVTLRISHYEDKKHLRAVRPEQGPVGGDLADHDADSTPVRQVALATSGSKTRGRPAGDRARSHAAGDRLLRQDPRRATRGTARARRCGSWCTTARTSTTRSGTRGQAHGDRRRRPVQLQGVHAGARRVGPRVLARGRHRHGGPGLPGPAGRAQRELRRRDVARWSTATTG